MVEAVRLADAVGRVPTRVPGHLVPKAELVVDAIEADRQVEFVWVIRHVLTELLHDRVESGEPSQLAGDQV